MPAKLFIVRPTLGEGGADRVTLTLLRELPRERFDLTLVLVRKEGVLLPEVPPDVTIRCLEARSLWTAWLRLTLLVRAHRPDILFSTSGGANMIAAIAHLLTGINGRLVLSERNALRSGISWKKRLQRWLKRALYPSADRITTVSRGLKQELVQELGLPAGSISVIYNPIVEPRLEAQAAEPVSHPWFVEGPQTGAEVILAVGRLVPEKDFATLLRAFTEVRRTHDARLLILGEGPCRGELKELAATLGVPDEVALPGYDPNPFRYMSRCGIFVLSSRFEGLPGALIQAMACGAPVISTDCPYGPAEILERPGSGILIPVGDSGALAAAIRKLLDDPGRRQRMAAEARVAAERFSVERVISNYIEVLT
ncbi:MAG: glycosyltransferase [Deltaproteobacteria bacterium]|nr:glycosyltransferase [Deltaproteobacteria bacterium]